MNSNGIAQIAKNEFAADTKVFPFEGMFTKSGSGLRKVSPVIKALRAAGADIPADLGGLTLVSDQDGVRFITNNWVN